MNKNLEFIKKTHPKDLMLSSLYLGSIIIYLSLAIIALIAGEREIFLLKIAVFLIFSIIFFIYLKTKRVKEFFLILILILEAENAYGVYQYPILNFTLFFPFTMIFGFFYFFRLKEALTATLLHYIFWIYVGFFIYLKYKTAHPLFNLLPTATMFAASLIIFIFSFIFHYSNTISLNKIAKKNRDNITLLNEIHHRIKNNLNMIASILGLQILNLPKEEKKAKEVLKNNKMRIEAIAMIHETLYREKHVRRVKFKKYIEKLSFLISESYAKHIKTKVESDDIFLSFETTFRIGIILNELMINAVKHSKTDTKEIYIEIILKNDIDDQYTLIYKEPLNKEVEIENIKKSKNLGFKLINLTVKQMKASMDISSLKGFCITMKFKNIPLLKK